MRISCRVEGGIAGAGENLPGFDLLHDDRTALGIAVVLSKRKNVGFQRVFTDLLQVDVYGQFDVFSRLRHGLIVFLQNRAVGGNRRDTQPVSAVQLVLKSLFQPLLADIGVHGVVLFLVDLIFFGIHQPDAAENMGSVGGVVLPDGGGFHILAGNIQLGDGCQRNRVHVVQKHVGGQGSPAAQIQLIADGDHAPGLLLRPVGGEVIGVLQTADELRRRDVAVPAALVQEGLEIAVPRGGILVRGVGIGLFHGHGKVIRHFKSQLIAEIGELAQILVRVFRAEHDGVDQRQVVAGTVADQHLAVAVEDLAARRGDARAVSVRAGGRVIDLTGLRDLNIIQAYAEDTGHDCDQQDEHADAKGKFMLIHSLLRFLRYT